MAVKPYKRNLFQRLLGKPQTAPPQDADCWRVEDGKVSIELERAPELSEEYGAIRLEGPDLPRPVLVMRDGKGAYRAFQNRCTHGGRRLDPVPGTETLCCCSMGRSRFDYDGKVVSGAAKDPIHPLAVEVLEKRLRVEI